MGKKPHHSGGKPASVEIQAAETEDLRQLPGPGRGVERLHYITV